MQVLSIGSLPPSWEGSTYGGVATLHATLLEGFLAPECPVEVIGVVPPEPIGSEPPVPIFARPPEEPIAAFYTRLLAELQPDVVIMHHFAHTIGLTHARMSDAPPAIGIAHSWHNITFRSGEERERARAVTEEALSGLCAVVGMSRHCLLEGEKLGLRYPAIAETIYHPLQPFYAADIEPGELGLEREGVAYLGSLIPRKNPAALVEAAERLPDLNLVLAGHGELEDSLRSLIGSLSLAARVAIRHLDDRQVRDLLLRSEAMCLPSRSETFGLAYIEALACGTPVVGFGPTLREIRAEIGLEIGEPLDSGDPAEVAAAIERVQATSWDRAELRRRTVEAFGLRAATERYVGLIDQVVGEKPRRSPEAVHTTERNRELSRSTAICILGMSRTGTSLTTRVLNLAGVNLGPEEELLGGELRHLAGEGETIIARAREANPQGFWEHYRLMRLNERILRALGGSWRDPPSLEPGWETSAQLATLRDEARALIAESFDGCALWGWKDPRNSLTLPFWQELVPNLRYVICLRNPLEVAGSIERRDGIPLQRGIELWVTYVAHALVNTSRRPRIFVPYASHFEDPQGTAARLATFVGRDNAFDDAEVRQDLAEIVDERLRRHHSSTSELLRSEVVPPEAASLQLITELLATVKPSGFEGEDDGDAGLPAAIDRLAKNVCAAERVRW